MAPRRDSAQVYFPKAKFFNSAGPSSESDLETRRSPRALRIFHLNVQCLRNKLDLLEAYLEQRECALDFVTLSEHWMDSRECQAVILRGYYMASHFSRDKASEQGGVVIFARHPVVIVERRDLVSCSVKGVCEIAAVQIPDCKTVLITVYRSTDRSRSAVNRFVNIMDDIFKLIDFTRFNVILNGDFNVWFHAGAHDERTVCSCFSTYGLIPTINGRTRRSKCLDFWTMFLLVGIVNIGRRSRPCICLTTMPL